MSPSTATDREEYMTIIAPTAREAMAQYKARGLDREGYFIAGQIGRHQVSVVEGGCATDLLGTSNMVAATFSRKVPA